MPNKNSLANKKRKRIKFDATSGSISGFLLSSSESVEINNSSDASLDASEVFDKLKPVKSRLSNEFDDSFDLFTSKKITKNCDEMSTAKTVSPVKKTRKVSPLKSSNSDSPRGKNKSKLNVIKKSNYFDQNLSIPCPFCFKFEEEIFTHMNANCIKPSSISDSTASQLIEIHIKYWQERRTLGIPDFTFNEDEVFKPITNQGPKVVQDASSESSSDCKFPILKWNSKSKRNKYLLLRQSQSERENKITQKLAILLMSADTQGKTEPIDEEPFETLDKDISSEILSNLSAKELTFWKKSSLSPDERSEDIYYIKALAPFIAPKLKDESNIAQPPNKDEDKDEPELVNAFATDIKEEGSSHSSQPISSQKKQDFAQNSLAKDSCFTEDEISGSTPRSFREFRKNDRFESLLIQNWEKIFKSSDLSDMVVLFSDGHFLGHSLVFYVYSMKIFRSISSSSVEESGKLLDWKDVSSIAGIAFIRFIYSGKTDHFIHLDLSHLEAIIYLCNKYDEVGLGALITDLIHSKNSDDCVQNDRNLTSPDIFEDIDSNDDLNGPCIKSGNRDSVNSSSGSKRKLQMSDNLDGSLSKKIKTDTPVECVENEVEHLDDDASLKEKKLDECSKQDDVISVSSEGKVSVSSAATMSPGRYEKMRPLSQCSTLPPLSESPKEVDKPDSPSSPLIFPDSPVNNSLKKVDEINSSSKSVKDEEKQESGDDHEPAHDEYLYYDHESFDYNNYINTTWPEPEEEKTKSPGEESEKETAVPSVKNSIDKYFNDSIPTELIDIISGEAVCKTPQSVIKSIKGSPMYQSTPTKSVVPSNNPVTPSPQIIVSDEATPLLNYSNMITPELKGELRKYGLKPDMDRKKAKTLLRYIYDLIHPEVCDINEVDALISKDDPNLRTGEIVSYKNEEPLVHNSTQTQDEEQDKVNTSTESILANENESVEDKGEYEFESTQEEIVSTQERSSYLNKNDLLREVSVFVTKDQVLFESILQYVPIWLDKLHQALKENQIKCTKVDLMDVLDELCITFRTERKVKEKKRRTKKK